MHFPGGPLLSGSLLLGLSALGAKTHALLLPGVGTFLGAALVFLGSALLLTCMGAVPPGSRCAKFLAGTSLALAGLILGTGTDPSQAPRSSPGNFETSAPQVVTRSLIQASRDRDLPAGWLPPGCAVSLVGSGETLLLARSIPAGQIQQLQRLGPEDLQLLAKPPARVLDGCFDRIKSLRARLLRRMDRLPSKELSALMGALLLGDRRKLSYETTDLFTRTGTRHLLALSGLHLAVLFGLLLLPLLRIFMRRFPGTAGRLGAGLCMTLVLAVFVPLAGGAPSLWRAASAAGLGFLAPLRGRVGQVLPRTDGCALLGLSLTWEVLVDPNALGRPGVQLTYLATFGLLTARGLYIPGKSNLLPAAPHEKLPLAWALLDSMPRLFLAGVRASLVASAITLPVLWLTFGEAAPIGLLATPLVTPIISALLVIGSLCVAVPNGLGAHLAEFLRQGLIGLLQAIDRLPLTPLNLPPRPALLVILLGLLAMLALRQRAGSTRPALLLAGVLLLPWATRARSLQLQVLDVGHGTAAVLEVPRFGLLVFDGGSRDRIGVGRALQRVLWDREADRVTYLTSHTDRDHTGALPWLARRFEAKQWWGLFPPDVSRNVLHGAHWDPAEGRVLLHQGAQLRLELLRGSSLGGNEGSRSLLVHAGDRTLMLWGDAEDEGALATLRHCKEESGLDLLLLPHHGRAGPALGAVLDQLQPSMAWASSSDLELPSQGTLMRRGIPLRVTTQGPLLWPPAEQGGARGP